jgi:hypothetical protein
MSGLAELPVGAFARTERALSVKGGGKRDPLATEMCAADAADSHPAKAATKYG